MKKSMIFLFLVLLSLGASPSGAAISLQSLQLPRPFRPTSQLSGRAHAALFPQDRADATFRIVPGLATPSKVSFESVNFPGHYLINLRGKVVLRRYENDPKFIAAATFAQHPGMADPTWVSFEAHNAPGAFLRHRGNNLRVEPRGRPPIIRTVHSVSWGAWCPTARPHLHREPMRLLPLRGPRPPPLRGPSPSAPSIIRTASSGIIKRSSEYPRSTPSRRWTIPPSAWCRGWPTPTWCPSSP